MKEKTNNKKFHLAHQVVKGRQKIDKMIKSINKRKKLNK